MQLAPSGVPLSFEVTFDSSSLDVGMTVYDDSGADPVLVQGPSAMALVAGNTYRAKFTPAVDKSYIVIKAVYTDDTLTTMSSDYAQGSESIIAKNLTTGPFPTPTCEVVGIVIDNDTLTGVVEC